MRAAAPLTYGEIMELPEIDVTTLAGLLTDGAPLIDVRQPDEFAEVRVPGARLIPLGELPDRVADVEAAAGGGTVYVICRSGSRSGQAVGFLRSAGVDAINVAGGTMAWVDSGAETNSGEPTG
jgi:rhodanese-related sulfurtransferase